MKLKKKKCWKVRVLLTSNLPSHTVVWRKANMHFSRIDTNGLDTVLDILSDNVSCPAHLSITMILSELRPFLPISWEILISFNLSPHLQPLPDSVHFSHIARLNILRYICVHGSSQLKYSRGIIFLQLITEILKLNQLFQNTDTNLLVHQYYPVFQGFLSIKTFENPTRTHTCSGSKLFLLWMQLKFCLPLFAKSVLFLKICLVNKYLSTNNHGSVRLLELLLYVSKNKNNTKIFMQNI